MMTLINPYPSTVFPKLGKAAADAQSAWREKLGTYHQKHFPEHVGESAERYVADRFAATQAGRLASDAFNHTTRAHSAACELHELVDLGGRLFFMKELSVAGRDAVYTAAAEHGRVSEWPTEVCDQMAELLSESPRPLTYAEVVDARGRALANTQALLNQILEERGLDPTKWTDADISKVAMAGARVDALDKLARRAQSLDSEWATRVVAEPAAKKLIAV